MVHVPLLPQMTRTYPNSPSVTLLHFHMQLQVATRMTKKPFTEDVCLKHLHTRCLFQKIIHRPNNTLLMELILTGNGASLSNSFLIKLAKFGELHGFNIIVDEILTGGRVTTLLTTLSKPKEFRKIVSYITIGKWTKCRVVFTSVVHDNKMWQLYASLGTSWNNRYSYKVLHLLNVEYSHIIIYFILQLIDCYYFVKWFFVIRF